MLKLVIADDVENIRESLSEMINLYCPGVKVAAMTSNVADTVKTLLTEQPDVLLLDVEMTDGTGFDVLKQFPDPKFKTIFITAYQHYSLEAFRFSALDYLLKPVDPVELQKAISKASDRIDIEKLSIKIESFLHNIQAATSSKKIVLKTADNIHVVAISEILYCEADEGYTNFHLTDGSKILVSRTLAEYDEMLSSCGFVRIHQSYLININYIKRYEKGDGGKVIMNNNVSLPVATRKKDNLLQILNKL